MPKPNEAAAIEALLDHQKNITSTFVTGKDLLERAREFARKWASKKLPGIGSYIPPFGHSSTSACYDEAGVGLS